MTCIVGLLENDGIIIGGDSAGVANLDIELRADPKVFENGPMIFGFTGSFRLGQLLQNSLVVPKRRRKPVWAYMTTTFVDAVRDCLKGGGNAIKKNDEESNNGPFMVGYEGRLFTVESDYQVGEPLLPFTAVGCGAQVAHGALYAMHLGPRPSTGIQQVRRALQAAEKYSAGVRGPFRIKKLLKQN